MCFTQAHVKNKEWCYFVSSEVVSCSVCVRIFVSQSGTVRGKCFNAAVVKKQPLLKQNKVIFHL